MWGREKYTVHNSGIISHLFGKFFFLRKIKVQVISDVKWYIPKNLSMDTWMKWTSSLIQEIPGDNSV